MQNQKLKIFLCSDHFERLCRGTVCDKCPSKPEHEAIVKQIANLTDVEEQKISEAILSEIQCVRQLQSQDHEVVVKLARAVLGDGNGHKGLNTRVMLIERDDRAERETSKSNFSHYIAIAGIAVSALMAIGAMVVSIVSLYT
jgi:hypothetical protein